MRQWLIRGARRGVGKTYVAKQLCAVLPASVYAKCGGGTRKHGKSPNFFTKDEDLLSFVTQCDGSYANAVIESNTLDKKKNGDINIFLESGATATDLRTDVTELKKRADICVCAGESRSNWRQALEERLDDPRLIDAVLDILTEQQRRLHRAAPGVRSKIWFVNPRNEHFFGPGLAQLLIEVEHLGSLGVAAERMEMSHEDARNAVEQAEAHLGRTLVTPNGDGETTAGATLTETGKKLLALYLRLNEKAAAFIDEEFVGALAEELDNLKERP